MLNEEIEESLKLNGFTPTPESLIFKRIITDPTPKKGDQWVFGEDLAALRKVYLVARCNGVEPRFTFVSKVLSVKFSTH